MKRSVTRGESTQREKALWFGGHGKWRVCAATVHVLIRGDLFDERLGVRPIACSHWPEIRWAGLRVKAGITRFLNKWLERKEFVSVRQLWIKAHGYS